mgnify:CR=1 FL=1
MAPDRFRVMEWVKQNSGTNAAGECEACFAHTPVSMYIAVRGKEIIGYACYDAIAPDFFGPTRVSRTEQGKGVGKALLADMSDDEIKSIWDKSDKTPLTEHTITDFTKFMEEILDRLDTLIVRYNIQNNTNIREVESAVAYPDDSYIHQDDLYDKIFPMDMSQKDDYGRYGKLKYVKSWINNIESMDGKEIDMAIYGGNGLNDVSAMAYIKGMKNGFVICPSNSDSEVKRIASYISTKAQAEGIKDGIDFINTSVWESIASNVCDYCKKGDLVGVKGRIQTRVYEKDEEKKYATEVVAEKVTFLSTGRNKEEE